MSVEKCQHLYAEIVLRGYLQQTKDSVPQDEDPVLIGC